MAKKKRSTPRSTTFDRLIAAAARQADIVPDFADLYDDAELDAMRDAYVREHYRPDSKAQWADPKTRARDMEHLYASMRALGEGEIPEDAKALYDLFWLCVEDRRHTAQAVDQEIHYQIGVAIGRRLSGGAR